MEKSKIARSPSECLLHLLKTRGPQTTGELAREVGVTHEAARQQLAKLASDGLVEASTEARGVGRPSQRWHVTTLGDRRFPDAHAELTVQLIRLIRSELGEAALETLLAAREAETRAGYRAEIADRATLEERVQALAAIRTREGYMAESRPEGAGYLLVENHCPVCAAATSCQGFCRAELEVFRDVLGPDAEVTRVEHIPAGGRRCAYRVLPVVRSGEGAEAGANRLKRER